MLNKRIWRISALPHDLYRVFGGDDRLLHVGVSVNVFRRIGQHKPYSKWYELADRIHVTQFSNRECALAEEARVIAEESPVFNVTNERRRNVAPTSAVDEFTMRRVEEGWYIDA